MFQFGISTRLAHSSTITHPGEKFQKINGKGKGKTILEEATKSQIESRGIVLLVEELKTNLMSLVFISLIFAQHVSNINMSIFRSLRL